MGWSKCLMEFNHHVTTLESMKQRDPVYFGPNALRLGRYRCTAYRKTRPSRQLNTTRRRRNKTKYYDGGPELNYKPPDQLLKSTLLQLIRHYSPIAAIHQIYSDSLKNPTWTWKHLYDQAKLVADDMADGIGGPKHGDGNRPPRYSDNSSATTNPSNSSNSSIRPIRNGENQAKRTQRCRNCNGLHGSWECPCRKCFYLDCNAPNFSTAEERQQHYMDVHAAEGRPTTKRRRQRAWTTRRTRTNQWSWTRRKKRRATSDPRIGHSDPNTVRRTRQP